MMSEETIFPSGDLTEEISILRMQLAISLKFHHSKTLEKLPKEVVMQVIQEVWQSCHPEVGHRTQNSDNKDVELDIKGKTIYL